MSSPLWFANHPSKAGGVCLNRFVYVVHISFSYVALRSSGGATSASEVAVPMWR